MAAGEDEGEFFNTQIACLKRQEHSQVAKQGREDFLSYIEDKNINQLMLMETLELIIGFGVQFDLLDPSKLSGHQHDCFLVNAEGDSRRLHRARNQE